MEYSYYYLYNHTSPYYEYLYLATSCPRFLATTPTQRRTPSLSTINTILTQLLLLLLLLLFLLLLLPPLIHSLPRYHSLAAYCPSTPRHFSLAANSKTSLSPPTANLPPLYLPPHATTNHTNHTPTTTNHPYCSPAPSHPTTRRPSPLNLGCKNPSRRQEKIAFAAENTPTNMHPASHPRRKITATPTYHRRHSFSTTPAARRARRVLIRDRHGWRLLLGKNLFSIWLRE